MTLLKIMKSIEEQERKLVYVNSRLRKEIDNCSHSSSLDKALKANAYLRELIQDQQAIIHSLIPLYNLKNDRVRILRTFKNENFEKLCSEEGISSDDLGDISNGEIIQIYEQFEGAEVHLKSNGEWIFLDMAFPDDSSHYDAIRIYT